MTNNETRFDVLPNAGDGWRIARNGRTVFRGATKREVLTEARRRARNTNGQSHLIVRGQNGRIVDNVYYR